MPPVLTIEKFSRPPELRLAVRRLWPIRGSAHEGSRLDAKAKLPGEAHAIGGMGN
jgi:hypothetical protein